MRRLPSVYPLRAPLQWRARKARALSKVESLSQELTAVLAQLRGVA